MINFEKLGPSTEDSVLPPREIFSVLPQKEDKYQYPRDVQTEVWNKWFEKRDTKDIVIKMNTGSGKTVVGLLALKSCLNEGKGPAVYVCPDSYLAKQVIKEANALGIEVTDDINSIRYERQKAILVTYVHRLFNGKSVFGTIEASQYKQIGSLIIDDAHACLETVEEQFTLSIPAGNEIYNNILAVFQEDLRQQNDVKLLEIIDQDPTASMLVPYWVWISKNNEVARILHAAKEEEKVKFVWPMIKESLLLCNCVIGGNAVEISPKCLPVRSIPSFVNANRRIFMTATLADDSVLVSHFNVSPECLAETVTPSHANDIGDRMILIPQEINPNITDDQIKQFLKEMSAAYNVVVIVPSGYRARYWSDVSDLTLTSTNLQSGVERLKTSHVGLTILINKYDGIDLPREACRILVLDGLPDCRRKIDKIEQGVLQGSDEVNASIVQRIEQGMGRGIRSNDDYCIVLLMGRSLTSKVYVDGILSKFTPATKEQINLSDKLAEQIRGKGISDLKEVMQYSLTRNPQWVGASRSALVHVKYNPLGRVRPSVVGLRNAFNAAERRDYTSAAAMVDTIVKQEEQIITRGWLKQQLAEYTHFTNPVTSQSILKAALADNIQVIKPIEGIQYTKLFKHNVGQAQECMEFLSGFEDPNKFLMKMNSLVDQLIFQPDTASIFEQALKEIASFVGFRGQRPEHEFGKGPDVLWAVGGLNYFVIEAKNGATTDTICKHDCNQLNGSYIWFKQKYGVDCTAVPIMIHPSNIFEYAATPDPAIRIITKDRLEVLRKSLIDFIKAAADSANFRNPQMLTQLIDQFNLTPDKFVRIYTVCAKVKNQ